MSNISAPKWDVEIDSLWFACPTLRTSDLNVAIKIGQGVDIGWISSVTVTLFYGRSLIGEMTLENEIFNISKYEDILYLEMGEFEIEDMIAFKNFVRDIMPKPIQKGQPDEGKPTAKLELIEKGHKLTMTIDLRGIGCFETTAPLARVTGTSIEITFTVFNTAAVAFFFEEVKFSLRKDQNILALVSGEFNIDANGERGNRCVLKGRIFARSQLHGKATLTASELEDHNNSWFVHAIRELEIEVDLDQVIVCEDE
ncbi:hypothetical protein J3E69DRAFT_380233 [Trichoderma sp. SZMC 28015]